MSGSTMYNFLQPSEWSKGETEWGRSRMHRFLHFVVRRNSAAFAWDVMKRNPPAENFLVSKTTDLQPPVYRPSQTARCNAVTYSQNRDPSYTSSRVGTLVPRSRTRRFICKRFLAKIHVPIHTTVELRWKCGPPLILSKRDFSLFLYFFLLV